MSAATVDSVIRVHTFDGQTVWFDKSTPLFEVGNFLGGGAAGTVYECEHSKTKDHFALKILNPVGYKMNSPTILRKCSILTKGKIYPDMSPSIKIGLEHVWWLLNTGSKQYIPSYYSERASSVRELSLGQCIDIWGTKPSNVADIDDDNPNSYLIPVQLSTGQRVYVPKLPPKYLDFIRKRDRIFREIKNMRKISAHRNVIKLEGVLELIQESKSTIFLVMELANGGELFDRIKVDCGTREETAKFFFQQLLWGVKHCHDQGVCHRDLKPENLLLQDTHDTGTILKIADFGFSARFAMASSDNDDTLALYPSTANLSDESPMRMLKSVVGSPFYVAPEVLQARGYDGPKADIWSLGVILYAMLAGNLPFGQELSTCKRFKHFCKWMEQYAGKGILLWNDPHVDYPEWLFPVKFSAAAKGLIVSMLHPDPLMRITVEDAMRHPLCISMQHPVSPQLNNSDQRSVDASSSTTHAETIVIGNDVIAGTQPASNRGTADSDLEICINDSRMQIEAISIAPTTTNSIIHKPDIQGTVSMDADDSDRSDNDSEDGVFAMEDDDDDSGRKAAKLSRHGKTPPKISHSTSYTMDEDDSSKSVYSGTSSGGSQCISIQSGRVNTSTSIAESPYSRFGFAMASSPMGTRPPLAPPLLESPAIDDLIPNSDDEGKEETLLPSPRHKQRPLTDDGAGSSNAQPPSFNEVVKRSTRFITAVPAAQVLLKVEKILEEYRVKKTVTAIGAIGRIDLDWSSFRLEVWGMDVMGPPICSLQLYQFSAAHSAAPMASMWSDVNLYGRSPSLALSSSLGGYQPQQELFMVEFVRGPIEIFGFKRFYEWLRQRLSELVKKDYEVFNSFDQSFSPKVDYQLLQRFQQMS